MRAVPLSAFVAGVGLIGCVALVACSKPEPPKIVPRDARVTSIGPAGVELLVRVEATNPNRVTLSAQSFTGKAKLDGRWDLGAVTVVKPVVLPPGVPTLIDVPLTMPWADVSTITSLAAARKPVPYVVEGTVTIGGESLNVTLPYSIAGTITQEQLAAAATRSIPSGLLPGLH